MEYSRWMVLIERIRAVEMEDIPWTGIGIEIIGKAGFYSCEVDVALYLRGAFLGMK